MVLSSSVAIWIAFVRAVTPPLIDIASDQYGNYIIQYILTHSNPQQREIVACHIRKYMVPLRGSKFGSRVVMLCANPAGPAIGTRLPPNPRYGGAHLMDTRFF